MGLRSTPESSNEMRRKEGLEKDLPDNIGSHLVIGVLFAIGLIHRPRAILGEILSKGPGSIFDGYRRFYENTRPVISYKSK